MKLQRATKKENEVKTLNTQDFLKSYNALHIAKYPSLNTNEYGVLSAILTVSYEFGKSLDEVQEVLNQKTRENSTELEIYLGEKVSA
jgi:gamma-glutamylcyclotransferase (GGCT)/AIG2-like uncharacterized protein YtfP